VLDLRPVELGGGLKLLGVELDATGDGSLCFLAVFEADLLTSEERLGVAKLRERVPRMEFRSNIFRA